MRTRRLAVLLTLAALVLAACAVPRERGDAPASTVPIDRSGVEAVLERYDRVRETASELLDAKPLSTVENGAVLAIDTGSFEVAQRLARAAGRTGTSGDVVGLATPRFTRYPLWFVVEVRDRAAEVNRVQVFERATAVDPWFLAGQLRSSANEKQTSSLGGTMRFDIRRAQVRRLPLDEQRAYGEAFRRLCAFESAIRQAADLGAELVRLTADGLALGVLEPDGPTP